MRVTREQAEQLRAMTDGGGTQTIYSLSTSYLAALDVCEALVEKREAQHDPAASYGGAATERRIRADAALDAALEKWREG